MGLPGAESAAGKLAYGAVAAGVIALCGWQVARSLSPPSPTALPCFVVCDACGALELDRAVPVTPGRGLELPVACVKCGERAAYLCYNCPACGRPLPVDPARPPARCKHCGADTAALFQPTAPRP